MWSGERGHRHQPHGTPAFRAIVEPRPQLLDRGPQAPAHGGVGDPELRADLGRRAVLDEVQQHDVSVGWREREHGLGEHALGLDPREQLVGRRAAVARALFAGHPPPLAARAHADDVLDDAPEPRPQRAIRRRLLRRDQPRILRDVGGDRVVTHERARQPAQPGGLAQQRPDAVVRDVSHVRTMPPAPLTVGCRGRFSDLARPDGLAVTIPIS